MSEDGRGLLGRVVLSVVVLVLSPFVELITGAAPIGTIGALTALAVIWGFSDEAEALEDAAS